MTLEEGILALEEVGLRIHRGETPPNIENTYLCDSNVFTYNEAPPDFVIANDYHYAFANQTPENLIELSIHSQLANDQASGLKGSISGVGDKYSVYIQLSGDTQGCHYKSLNIYSGDKQVTGIYQWQMGFVLMEKSGDNCEVLMGTGRRRITEESDGVAAVQP